MVSSYDGSVRVKTRRYFRCEQREEKNCTRRGITSVYYAITSRASCRTDNGRVYRLFDGGVRVHARAGASSECAALLSSGTASSKEREREEGERVNNIQFRGPPGSTLPKRSVLEVALIEIAHSGNYYSSNGPVAHR